MSYLTGMVAAVPTDSKAAYVAMCNRMWPMLTEYGATGGKDCWGVDVPEGKLTSFPMAVKAEANETVCLSWIIWPDKATADACWAAMETEERWQAVFAEGMVADGKRMIFGGFEEIAGF